MALEHLHREEKWELFVAHLHRQLNEVVWLVVHCKLFQEVFYAYFAITRKPRAKSTCDCKKGETIQSKKFGISGILQRSTPFELLIYPLPN